MSNSMRTRALAAACGAALGMTAIAFGQCEPRWELAPGAGPSPRLVGAMAHDAARNVDVLFGGTESLSGNVYHGDTWEFNRTTRAWSLRSSTGPQARYGVTGVYMGDSTAGSVFIFGGSTIESGAGVQNDTWRWDGNAWQFVTSGGPTPRYGASMAYDSARNRVVLFGGFLFNNSANGETWEFDGTSWMLVSTFGPPARGYAGLAYDAARGTTVMFGGNTPTGAIGDTWEWNGSSWTQVTSPQQPSARLAPVMEYDPVAQRVVLFSGLAAGIAQTDTWIYDGQWHLLPPPAVQPSGRAGAFTAMSPSGEMVVMGGHEGSSTAADTWVFTCGISGGCYANCDDSTSEPILNVADFGCFLQKFAAGDPYANCDQSTTPPVLNVADFGCFLQSFAAGCR